GAIKVGVTDVPPFVFAFARAVAVAGVLTLIAVAVRQPFPRGKRTVLIATIVGLINIGLTWAIIFWSEQLVPSGLVAVFGSAAPDGRGGHMGVGDAACSACPLPASAGGALDAPKRPRVRLARQFRNVLRDGRLAVALSKAAADDDHAHPGHRPGGGDPYRNLL